MRGEVPENVTIPCTHCDATGWLDEGIQLDADLFKGCECDWCDGHGNMRPDWRPAGKRDTTGPREDWITKNRLARRFARYERKHGEWLNKYRAAMRPVVLP